MQSCHQELELTLHQFQILLTTHNFEELIPGDLVFFGTASRCTHVAIYKGQGFYWHSSGVNHGRNGIGFDCLSRSDMSPLACHYRSKLRGAGRVNRCHDGSTLP